MALGPVQRAVSSVEMSARFASDAHQQGNGCGPLGVDRVCPAPAWVSGLVSPSADDSQLMRVGRASTRLERHPDALAFPREGQPERSRARSVWANANLPFGRAPAPTPRCSLPVETETSGPTDGRLVEAVAGSRNARGGRVSRRLLLRSGTRRPDDSYATASAAGLMFAVIVARRSELAGPEWLRTSYATAGIAPPWWCS